MSDIYYITSYLFFLFVSEYGGEAPLTACQHGLTFSCSRMGPQLIFHVYFTNYLFQAFQNKEMKCTKKSLLTDILASQVSHLYWHESKMYISYCFQLLTMWLIWNFCFCCSFLPSELISDFLYSKGMRYYLHFRGYIRLTNYNFHAHVQNCITIHYHICYIDKYRHVEGPICHNFGRLGISCFE